MAGSLPERIAQLVLNDYILSGDLVAGSRLPTMRELRDRYKISNTTMVHALSILELQGVLERRQGSGCFVKIDPIGIAKPTRSMVGFVCPATDVEHVLSVYEGIQHVCAREDRNILIASANDFYESERKEVSLMIEAGCEAIILFPVARTIKQLKTDYLNREHLTFPIIIVDMAVPEHKRSQVIFDNYRAGFDMTQMLIYAGHHRVVFMRGDSRNHDLIHPTNHARYRGYLDAMRQAEIEPCDPWILYDDSSEPFRDQLKTMMVAWGKDSNKPTALIAYTDNIAMEAMHIAQGMGVLLPDELRVCGFDDVHVGRSFIPSFPTTGADFVRAGEYAAELALRQANAQRREQIVYVNVLPAPVIRRISECSFTS